MSYILNALRKSERERQAMQPDSVTSRIAIEQTPERHGLTKIIVALVLLNLAILIYFLGIAPQKPADKAQPLVNIEEAAPLIAKANPQLPADSPPKPAKLAPTPKTEPPRNPTSAAEKLAANTKQAVEPVERVKPTVAPAQPVKPLPTVTTAATPASKPTAEIERQSKLVPQRIEEPSEQAVAKKPEPVALARLQNDLPTLQDLPPDVRQSLPALPINVFSYSPTPAERFVMIDMVKYVPGQTIKDQLELKEIVEDGIIVRYQGRVFKIKR
ncbi:general secretion pathway protein GspB [Methylomonas sp. EFPC1]|uniref:general secretion pathway protein GspB n=1 Tax=Methylomonas sp. EFPC1 TaxID=2812647 RepID=UPI0019674728|nr:general secretion pathway protein GspB [Methylomonas sp. EFPC1]QSB00491.1 general secretion pathway protein GspB [Methylomonas sp. EFPC1]